MRLLRLVPGVTMLFLALPVWAQTPAPPPQCEPQVQEQYQALVKDQLLATTPDVPWPLQLTLIASQVRTLRHQYDIKKQQAELAEQNVAQLLEQLRLARQQNGALQAEVERLKTNGSPPRN